MKPQGLLLLISSVALLSFAQPLHGAPQPTVGCGIRNVGGIGPTNQANNHEAAFGEFPWTVAILNHTDNEYLASGSLIHPQVVMTSRFSRETPKPEEILVRAGEWNFETKNEPHEYQERSVQSIIRHLHTQKRDDFVLLFLSEPFVLDKHINVICLPDQNMQPAANTSCLETGWSRFDRIINKRSDIMHQITLPIVDFDECQTTFSKISGQPIVLDQSDLCAGGNGIESRDSGSPLVCPIGTPSENRYQQSGIASWSVLNTNGDVPMGYVNVAMLRDWIDEQMEAKGFGTTSYTIP